MTPIDAATIAVLSVFLTAVVQFFMTHIRTRVDQATFKTLRDEFATHQQNDITAFAELRGVIGLLRSEVRQDVQNATKNLADEIRTLILYTQPPSRRRTAARLKKKNAKQPVRDVPRGS